MCVCMLLPSESAVSYRSFPLLPLLIFAPPPLPLPSCMLCAGAVFRCQLPFPFIILIAKKRVEKTIAGGPAAASAFANGLSGRAVLRL